MKNLKITVNGVSYDVQVEETGAAAPMAAPAANPVAALAPAAVPAPVAAPVPAAAPAPVAAPAADAEIINCPMPGTIVSVDVTAGQTVAEGDILVILEAMKMENEIMAPHAGVIAAIHVSKGESVDSGTPLVSFQ